MEQFVSLLKPMKDRIDGLMSQLDINGKLHRVEFLETEASTPDFWNNPDQARQINQEMARLKDEVNRWQ